ncbi:MAG: trigger factor [Alphaproteobacteria bacterium]|nr:trigger factor [Alphaproteobacteria bacterium]
MQVTETLTDGLKREFKVVITAKDIGEKIGHRLDELTHQVRLPGFRPGKVPRRVVEQRYRKAVLGEVLEMAVGDSSRQALAERGLRPALQPRIEVTKFDDGSDLEYTMKIELLPEIQPMDFAKLELERLKAEVTDEAIDKALTTVAKRFGKTEKLAEARPAEKGDVLVIDFLGKIDGEAFAGGEAKDHYLELGSGRFIEGFEDQLIGKSAGDKLTVNVTFPEQYGNEKLAGKPATFDVEVKEIHQRVQQNIDDELAKMVGAPDLAGLKQSVRQQLEQEHQQQSRLRLKRQLLDKLADAHPFTVPPGMVESEFEAIWRQLAQDQGQSEPKAPEGPEAEDYRKIAERRVRLGLLLAEVGRLNNIQVNDQEVQRAMMQRVQEFPGQERQVLDFYNKNPQALAHLRAPIYEEKVVDFIVEMAKVAERQVTTEELFKADEDEAAKA